jgi:hypothetical protein
MRLNRSDYTEMFLCCSVSPLTKASARVPIQSISTCSCVRLEVLTAANVQSTAIRNLIRLN